MHGIIAKPRGFCAGVERAIRAVELALEEYGPPIYVRKEIVHNSHVVERLRERGARFVDELDEVPAGAIAILSAHGSPPQVFEDARERGLRLIDATCPLVTKVHQEVHRYARDDYRIIFIGHAGHDEVVGTMGQAPERSTLIGNASDVQKLDLKADQPGIILTQTTLSQDDARGLVDALKGKHAHLELPSSDDICYATQNRQNAVKEIAPRVDLLLVVGSNNSSNSRRLTEVALDRGVASHLINDECDIDPDWLKDVSCVGLTSGASAPEDVVQRVVRRLDELGVTSWEEVDAPDEGVVFKLPSFVQLSGSAQANA